MDELARVLYLILESQIEIKETINIYIFLNSQFKIMTDITHS